MFFFSFLRVHVLRERVAFNLFPFYIFSFTNLIYYCLYLYPGIVVIPPLSFLFCSELFFFLVVLLSSMGDQVDVLACHFRGIKSSAVVNRRVVMMGARVVCWIR